MPLTLRTVDLVLLPSCVALMILHIALFEYGLMVRDAFLVKWSWVPAMFAAGFSVGVLVAGFWVPGTPVVWWAAFTTAVFALTVRDGLRHFR